MARIFYRLKASLLPSFLLVSVVVFVVFMTSSGAVLAKHPNKDKEADFETDAEDKPVMLDGSAESLAIATSNGVQCETITIPHCKHMMYNKTRMPNFFDDFNQIEAHTRAQSYLRLIESSCNPSISTYMCQLIAPVCLEQDLDTMDRFKIYPCRTFCRRMRLDCAKEISVLNKLLRNHLAPAFNCDRLPYESNGGNSSSNLYGPCHDPYLDEHDNTNQYSPFQRHVGDPYITDNSAIELGEAPSSKGGASSAPPMMSPAFQPAPPTNQQTNQQHRGWKHQVSLFGQGMIAYSNIISIIIVVVLLIALGLKRLRFKRSSSNSLTSSASLASSSTAVSTGHKPNHGGSGGGGGGSGGYHTALIRQQQIYSNILLSSPSHQVLLLSDGSSPARSKLHHNHNHNHHHQHQQHQQLGTSPRAPPPQMRAPLPPAPFAYHLSSDQQSSSGYYEPVQ